MIYDDFQWYWWETYKQWLIDSRLSSMPTDHKSLRSFQRHSSDKHKKRKKTKRSIFFIFPPTNYQYVSFKLRQTPNRSVKSFVHNQSFSKEMFLKTQSLLWSACMKNMVDSISCNLGKFLFQIIENRNILYWTCS